MDFDELLARIPELIGRLIPFDAFAVYLFDSKRDRLTIGYAVGYPENVNVSISSSEGIVGRVVRTQETVLLDDIRDRPQGP